jgi:hypothetical protein
LGVLFIVQDKLFDILPIKNHIFEVMYT